MKRVLVTGMSGTGKSTVIAELMERGYKAVDADTGEWSEWVDVGPDDESGSPVDEPGIWRTKDWVWREDRIQQLLATEDAEVLFLSGCASNMRRFYAQFDRIVLLSAPVHVLCERLATRTTNAYGKNPDELARILRHVQTVEPLLRRIATLVVDTSPPVAHVIAAILDHL